MDIDIDNMLLQGEFNFVKFPPDTIPGELGYTEFLFGLCKGKVFLGYVFKHLCGKWVYQHIADVDLTLEGIRALGTFMAQAEEDVSVILEDIPTNFIDLEFLPKIVK